MFDASPIAMALVCPQGLLVALHRAMRGVTGRSTTDLVGTPVADILHGDEHSATRRAIDEVLADGTILRARGGRI